MKPPGKLLRFREAMLMWLGAAAATFEVTVPRTRSRVGKKQFLVAIACR
jgi:hypothetical protein